MKDDNDDWHEMHSYEDLIEFLKIHYTNPQDDVYRS